MDDRTHTTFYLGENMMAETFCPIHGEIQKDLREIKATQIIRPCLDHTARIQILEKADSKLEDENQRQWDSIGRLERIVYTGAGIAALASFLGSAFGRYLLKP
jgi:hypothetical protein